ncbi:MAG: hypothetical protein K2X37_08435, partial [Chitinophagaceae bacterium]|nr:hypothetical protein [Chitinophagaceae bacterium]
YPSVSTYDLAIQEREADLVIATFGRALWILDDIRPLRKLAANKGQVFAKKLTAFDAPQAYQAKIKNAAGIEYSTYGTYEGENRRTGAALSFYVQKSATDTGKNKLSDTLQVRIMDAAGNNVRNLRTRADSGFNRFYWGLEGKGIRAGGGGRGGGGGRFGGGAGNAEPGGLPVDPGTYKVVLSLGRELTDSMMVVVNDDPNAPTPKELRDALRKANTRIEQSTMKITAITERLTELEDIMKKVEAGYGSMERKDADTLRKVAKLVADGIKEVREMLNGKPQTKQGYGNIPQETVNGLLGEARSLVMGKTAMPGAQENRAMTEAEEAVTTVVKKANTLFDGVWKQYRTLAEAAPVKYFKDYKAIE